MSRYFLEVADPKYVVFYEPHCVLENAKLDDERADVIVTPVNKQVLPGYTLVSGQEDAVQLSKLLQPKYNFFDAYLFTYFVLIVYWELLKTSFLKMSIFCSILQSLCM